MVEGRHFRELWKDAPLHVAANAAHVKGLFRSTPQREPCTSMSRVRRETPAIPSPQVAEGASTFFSHNPFLLQTFLLAFSFSRYFLLFREDSVVCESFLSDIHVFFILSLKSDILKNFDQCRITAGL